MAVAEIAFCFELCTLSTFLVFMLLKYSIASRRVAVNTVLVVFVRIAHFAFESDFATKNYLTSYYIIYSMLSVLYFSAEKDPFIIRCISNYL